MLEDFILDEKESNEELALTKNAKKSLDAMQKWTLFLAIVLFVFSTWLAYRGISLMLMENPYADMANKFPDVYQRKNPFKMIGIITLIFGLLFLFPAFFLITYSLNSKKFLDNNSPEFLEKSLINHKYFYMFFGSFVILIVVFAFAFWISGANAVGLFI